MAQKMIRLDNDVYTELERIAPIEGRSISNLASHLIRGALKADKAGHLVSPVAENQLELPGVFENTEPLKPGTVVEYAVPREKQIVMEINRLDNTADEANQDPDYWNELNEKKQALWAEWHELTGK